MKLKFHWRLLQGGENRSVTTRATGASQRATGLPDLEQQIEFCRQAEVSGITGLLTDVGASKPDPILLAAALGLATERIEFIVAYRSGLTLPTTFVQQLNTLSALVKGRVSLNIVAGHSPVEQRYYGDYLVHSERYARTEEFLAICRAFWKNDGPVNYHGKYYCLDQGQLNTPFLSPHRRFPELFIAGGSDEARNLAISQGTLWMRLADTPENVRPSGAPVLAAGKEVGLRMSIITRSTRQEAVHAAYELLSSLDPAMRDREKEARFMTKSDSVSINATYALAEKEWLNPWLWTGAVRTHGAPAVSLVGSFAEVAQALIEYARIGVTQFILSGWPKLDEMILFGNEILPRVRQVEAKLPNRGLISQPVGAPPPRKNDVRELPEQSEELLAG
jgi:alkanesulfonate monooxygenase